MQTRESMLNQWTVHEVDNSVIWLLGKVSHPGRYTLEAPSTLRDLLAQFGEPSEDGFRSYVLIFRPQRGRMKRIRIPYDELFTENSQARNLYVHGGDLVVVL